jgi:alkylation response protein AidB-like acyl-CoA dehydrogenase
MNFGFSEEQELLRAEVRKFLDQNAPLDEVRKIVEAPDGFAGDSLGRSLWNRMAELGWVGLTIPELYGGVGLDWVTAVVLLEETGRSLFPSPLISTMIAARAIERAGSEEQKARWLPQLADGSRIGSFALLEQNDSFEASEIQLEGKPDGALMRLSGSKRLVQDAAVADLFVVAFRSGSSDESISLAVIEAGEQGVAVDAHASIDLTKPVGDLQLRDVAVAADSLLGEVGSGWPLVSELCRLGAMLVTAEMVGAAEAAVSLTTEFAKQRIQFDSPIGRYQGVKHPLAEMYVDVESFKSLLYYAAWAMDEGAPDAALAVSRAKAYANGAFARIGLDGVQLHGGVGYTWEYDIQLYLKRSKWARPAFGDTDYHYARIASEGGL